MENNKTINQTQHKKDVAVIWARVSQESQTSGLASQVEACREFAGKHNIEVARTFKVIKSGFSNDIHKEMLTFIAQHPEVNTVLIYSFDRFSRTGAEAIITKAFLQTKGVAVISITQPQGYDSIAGDLLESAFYLYNQFENNFCRARRHRHYKQRYAKEQEKGII